MRFRSASRSDRLLIFANDGKLMSTAANGYSFEMAYTLDMIITDYSGDVDVFGVVLLHGSWTTNPSLWPI